jgi:Ca2+-binding RTX toxin-like protein
VSKKSIVWATAGAVSALLAVAAQTAYGASVSVGTESIDYVAAPGEANRLTVAGKTNTTPFVTSAIVFTDPGAVITAGAGCHSVSTHEATCDEPDTFYGYTFAINLGDQNDTAKFTNSISSKESDVEQLLYELLFELDPGPLGPGSPYPDIDGGAGNDVLRIGAEQLGFAVLRGGPGNDQLIGNTESDALLPGTGADVIKGGDGTDGVGYADRTTGVRVSLDDVANDGEPGEGDNVASDVEDIGTGAGNDVVTGSSAHNHIYTWDGNDVVSAGGEIDTIDAGAGDDTLNGGGANDLIIDGPGNDFVAGGAGDDQFYPELGLDPVDQGADRYYGGAGQDHLYYDGGERSTGVRVTFDDAADDGASGEGDDVHDDVEIVRGTVHDDVLIGDEHSNWLIGGGGQDRLIGGNGIDILNDTPSPQFAAPSYLDGGAGTDVITSRNAGDTVTCGAGVDILGSATLHPADCEIVDPTFTLTREIEDACGLSSCAATIDSVLKR